MAYNHKGVVLKNLNRKEEAVESYEESISRLKKKEKGKFLHFCSNKLPREIPQKTN